MTNNNDDDKIKKMRTNHGQLNCKIVINCRVSMLPRNCKFSHNGQYSAVTQSFWVSNWFLAGIPKDMMSSLNSCHNVLPNFDYS